MIDKSLPYFPLTLIKTDTENYPRRSLPEGFRFVFYRAGDDASRALAKAIQSILNGLETQPKSFSALAGDYYVLNNLDCPAVIVECGFLSSRVDEGLFLEDAHRKRVAEAVFNGVMEYLS